LGETLGVHGTPPYHREYPHTVRIHPVAVEIQGHKRSVIDFDP
jgi:hypothetical protein